MILRVMILLVMGLMLAACGPEAASDGEAGAGDDAAAAAVEDYLTAKVASDDEAIRGLLCSSMEADFDREAMSFDGVEASIEGMACSSDEGGNTVTCEGTIEAVYGGENRDFPLGTYNVVEEDGEWKWCGESG